MEEASIGESLWWAMEGALLVKISWGSSHRLNGEPEQSMDIYSYFRKLGEKNVNLWKRQLTRAVHILFSGFQFFADIECIFQICLFLPNFLCLGHCLGNEAIIELAANGGSVHDAAYMLHSMGTFLNPSTL